MNAMNQKDIIPTLANRISSMGLISNLIHKSGSADVTRPHSLDVINRGHNTNNSDHDHQRFGYLGLNNNPGYRVTSSSSTTGVKTSSEFQLATHVSKQPQNIIPGSQSPVIPSSPYCYPSQVVTSNGYNRESPTSQECVQPTTPGHVTYKNNLPPGTPILQVHDLPSSYHHDHPSSHHHDHPSSHHHDHPSSHYHHQPPTQHHHQQSNLQQSYTPPPYQYTTSSSSIPIVTSANNQFNSMNASKRYVEKIRSSQSPGHKSRANTPTNTPINPPVNPPTNLPANQMVTRSASHVQPSISSSSISRRQKDVVTSLTFKSSSSKNSKKLTAWGTELVKPLDKMNQENVLKHTELIRVSSEEKKAIIQKWIYKVNSEMGIDLSKVKVDKLRSLRSPTTTSNHGNKPRNKTTAARTPANIAHAIGNLRVSDRPSSNSDRVNANATTTTASGKKMGPTTRYNTIKK